MISFKPGPYFWADLFHMIRCAVIVAIGLCSMVLIGCGIYEVKGSTHLAWYVLITVSLVIVGLSVWYNGWEDMYYGTTTTAQKNYVNNFNNGKYTRKAKKMLYGSVLMDDEREKPPRAKFFGRIDGEVIDIEGKYEEKYLNMWELGHWKGQKTRKEAIEAGLVNEIDEKDVKDVNLPTKSIYTT